MINYLTDFRVTFAPRQVLGFTMVTSEDFWKSSEVFRSSEIFMWVVSVGFKKISGISFARDMSFFFFFG